MTAPFRDPIIYPGAPLETATGKWGELHEPRRCALGDELMRAGVIARWTGTAWECREHAWGGTP